MNRVAAANAVLVGEDHFTAEVPCFCRALAHQFTFVNFVFEIDPYCAKILQQKFRNLHPDAMYAYYLKWGGTFSFYALEPEFRLLQELTQFGARLYGTDQVLLVADRLLCSELKQLTKLPAARRIYGSIEAASEAHFAAFLKDSSQPFYLLTNAFARQTDLLLKLPISAAEREQVAAMQLSARIYKRQDHHLRIQYMKAELMKAYPAWLQGKTLFTYGAIHTAKGERLLRIYDIGNLVHTLNDSRGQSSLHLTILGKSGMQGAPFRGFPASPVNANSKELRSLQPFFALLTDQQWRCFDLRPLQQDIEKGTLQITDNWLLRLIKGNDLLILIPEVTAATFPKKK